MEQLQSTTITAQDITSPLLLATYTVLAVGELYAQVHLSGLVGGGSYKVCLTKQVAGAGSIYQSATSAIGVGSNTFTAYITTVAIPAAIGDVIKVYAHGLTGDTAVNGLVVINNGAYNAELAAIIEDTGTTLPAAIAAIDFDTTGITDAIDALQGADSDTLEDLSDQLDAILTIAPFGVIVQAELVESTTENPDIEGETTPDDELEGS